MTCAALSREATGKKRTCQHGEPGAPSRGGDATERDLALNYISDPQKNNFEFKGRVVRSYRQKFMVFENVQYDFSVNEAIWITTCIVISVLRDTNVEQIQQIHCYKGEPDRRLAMLKSFLACQGQMSWEESPIEVVFQDIHKDFYKQCTAKVYVFTNFVFLSWSKCVQNILRQREFGNKTDSAILPEHPNTENWTTSMENPLCSIRRFSWRPEPCSFTNRSKS